VIFDLFRESIRQPREAPRAEAQGQVGTLCIAGADMRRVGSSFNRCRVAPMLSTRAVAARAGRISVILDEHGVADVGAKGLLYLAPARSRYRP
jgi:hypothetical protein